MKLLIVTQKINKNDPILGFFHGWIREFSKHFESIVGICLEKGEYDLPANVKVLSLGKEIENGQFSMINDQSLVSNSQFTIHNSQFIKRLRYTLRFWSYIWRERKNYDAVFVHMNQEYILLGGLFWRVCRKKIGLWYVHKKVTFCLRLATILTNHVFTSAKESFGINSKKVNYVGHGIDVNDFDRYNDGQTSAINASSIFSPSKSHENLKIISVSRISPVKHLEVLIEALPILRDQYKVNAQVIFVGSPTNESDEVYFRKLQERVKNLNLDGAVNFIGSINNKDIKNYYWNSDISVNMSPTGGMDKVVLESMASGVPIFVSNNIFANIFGEYSDMFIFLFNSPKSLAQKISEYLKRENKDYIIKAIIKKSKTFDLKELIKKIVDKYKTYSLDINPT